MRSAPNFNQLQSVSFFGIKRVVSPLTEQEIIEAGYLPGERADDYVEDTTTSKNPLRQATFFQKKSHLVVNGTAGTGKEVWVDALAHATNRPLARFAFKVGVNPADYLARVELVEVRGATVTKVTDGDLLRATRGVSCVRDLSSLDSEVRDDLIKQMEEENYKVERLDDKGLLKITVPSIILFSDYDRATPEQVEFLRQATELDKEKIAHPVTGKMYPVLKGTRIILTSNSGADGDGGRGNITRAKDASFLSRLSAVMVPPHTQAFEKKVITAAFPVLSDLEVQTLSDCIRAVRRVSHEDRMGIEITLRQAKMWGSLALDWLAEGLADTFNDALKDTFESVVGHLMEDHNRDALQGAIDTYLSSDVVNEQSVDAPTPIDM